MATMHFRRLGRSYHLRIRSANDLQRIAELDDAHWLATNAPIGSLNCDATFLALLDGDGNGRITADELRDAVTWTLEALGQTDGLLAGSDTITLTALNAQTELGASLRDAVGRLLGQLDRPDAGAVSLEDIRRVKAELEARPVSAAGVVLPEAAEDETVRRFLEHVVAVTGSGEHPTGRVGVGAKELDAFLAQATACLDWLAAGDEKDLRPLGDATLAAWQAYAPLRDKLEQFFAQCRAIAMDPALADRAGPDPAARLELDLSDPVAIEAYLAKAPLASPTAAGQLPLRESVNPHYADALERFARDAVAPLLAREADVLTPEGYRRVRDALEPFGAHQSNRPDERLLAIPVEILQTYLAPRFREAVRTLIARSRPAEFAVDAARSLEKMALYQANLLSLANNFVSFPHLYDARRRALFEMGTLVVAGRRLNFAVRVANRGAHAEVAREGNMFVVYAEVLPPAGEAPYEVALPLTAGGKGPLRVGRRCVFRETSGRLVDARIVGMIENPVSAVEAVTAPFHRLGRMLSGRIESIGAAAGKRFDSRAETAVQAVPTGETPAQPASAASKSAVSGGLLMGGAVAVAAVGSAVAYITKTLANVRVWQVLTAVGATLGVIIVPIVLVALFKLRRRDLGVVLEGAGWAINGPMRLSRRQAQAFTRRPSYPRWTRLRAWAGHLALLAALAAGGILLWAALR
ncbi:MAG: hypothetical protein ACOC8F_00205 [Planctomycetota bacterium]